MYMAQKFNDEFLGICQKSACQLFLIPIHQNSPLKFCTTLGVLSMILTILDFLRSYIWHRKVQC